MSTTHDENALEHVLAIRMWWLASTLGGKQGKGLQDFTEVAVGASVNMYDSDRIVE